MFARISLPGDHRDDSLQGRADRFEIRLWRLQHAGTGIGGEHDRTQRLMISWAIDAVIVAKVGTSVTCDSCRPASSSFAPLS